MTSLTALAQHVDDILNDAHVLQDAEMTGSVTRELLMVEAVLVALPLETRVQALRVHRTVTVAVRDLGLRVRELVRAVREGGRGRHVDAMQTVDLDARMLQVLQTQTHRVLTHRPAASYTNKAL